MPDQTGRRAEIAARIRAATPGPWEAQTLPPTELHKHPAYWVNTEYTDAEGVTTFETVADCPWREADAQFIAHARQDVPWLLAYAESAAETGRYQQKHIAELTAELAKYVGKEPTIADEMAYLQRCLNDVYELCDQTAAQATRWEHPLPIPEWVTAVRQAADGDRPATPDDKRRRIYLDGKGNAWIDAGLGEDGTQDIAGITNSWQLSTAHGIRTETGSLHEIGRCW